MTRGPTDGVRGSKVRSSPLTTVLALGAGDLVRCPRSWPEGGDEKVGDGVSLVAKGAPALPPREVKLQRDRNKVGRRAARISPAKWSPHACPLAPGSRVVEVLV